MSARSPRVALLPLPLALLLVGLGCLLLPGGEGRAAPRAPRLSWFGQSCFLLETPGGTRLVMDPLSASVGFPAPENLRADIVTISHEHPDHNNVGLIAGAPRVVHGLTRDRKGWMKLDEKFRDISYRTIGVYHDEKDGQERGLNTIFVIETAGMRIAHLGDLGHVLTDEQLSELGQVDVALVPVGGHFTIDADQAAHVVDQIRPRLIIIPMHYRTSISTIKDLATVDSFLAGRTHVRHAKDNTVDITSLKKRPGAEVVVLRYQ